MRVDLADLVNHLVRLLAVVARVSGALVFIPLPGMQATPDMAKIVLIFVLAFLVAPSTPPPPVDSSIGAIVVLVMTECAFGLLVGLTAAFVLESGQIAAQMIGLQAGYSFASTIDPTTQADSGILQILIQLLSGTMFLALGLEREVLRALAHSPGGMAILSNGGMSIVAFVGQLGSRAFAAGLRLALPVVSLLILLDLSFAIMAKVHSQFQVMSLSFPAKMLAGLAVLAMTLSWLSVGLETNGRNGFTSLVRFIGR